MLRFRNFRFSSKKKLYIFLSRPAMTRFPILPLALCTLTLTSVLGLPLADPKPEDDLAPSDSSLHYAYGRAYGYQAAPYGGHVGGYEHSYGHHTVDDGYGRYGGYGHGYGHGGYADHHAHGKIFFLNIKFWI